MLTLVLWQVAMCRLQLGFKIISIDSQSELACRRKLLNAVHVEQTIDSDGMRQNVKCVSHDSYHVV